jgi:hypothetical protein
MPVPADARIARMNQALWKMSEDNGFTINGHITPGGKFTYYGYAYNSNVSIKKLLTLVQIWLDQYELKQSFYQNVESIVYFYTYGNADGSIKLELNCYLLNNSHYKYTYEFRLVMRNVNNL